MTNLRKRAWTEYNKLKGLSDSSSTVKFTIESSAFDTDPPSTDYKFIGRIFPTSNPFNQIALKVEIKLPDTYPGKPPIVRLLTQVHHPNVFDDGSICLTILDPTESWKQSHYLDAVVKELVTVIDHPDLNLAVNEDVANEYLYKKEEYDRKALQIVQKNIVSRT